MLPAYYLCNGLGELLGTWAGPLACICLPSERLRVGQGHIPRSGNLLYPSLVLPELKEVGGELNVYMMDTDE